MAPKTRRKTDTTETATAVATPPPMEARLIPVAEIDAAHGNPRKHFDETALADLVASVRLHGVLQPILVREGLGDRFQIVAGERRWRAAKAAGLTEIPAVVRDMSDREALELALVENITRADLSPVEEGDAFHELVEVGATVEEIAAKVGRSKSYVSGRLRLHELPDVAREMMAAGTLDVSRALLVASVRGAEHQAQAARILAGAPTDQDVSAHSQWKCQRATNSLADAREFVRFAYTLVLANAPFDVKDARLIADAGSCLKCPKMTKNQADLFGEVSDKDRCTDAACWAEKSDAAWSRVAAAAIKAGKRVLTLADPEMREIDDGSHVALSERAYQDAERRTWGELLGKKLPPVTVVRTHDGSAEEYVEHGAAVRALAAAGHEWAAEEVGYLDAAAAGDEPAMSDEERQAELEEARAARLKGQAEAVAVGEVLGAAATNADELPMLAEKWILIGYLREHPELDRPLARRFNEGEMPTTDDDVTGWLVSLQMPDLRGIAVEALAFELGTRGPEREFADLMRAYGKETSDAVNVALHEVERQFAAEAQAAVDAEEADAKPTKGKRGKKAKRAADEEE